MYKILHIPTCTWVYKCLDSTVLALHFEVADDLETLPNNKYYYSVSFETKKELIKEFNRMVRTIISRRARYKSYPQDYKTYLNICFYEIIKE